MIQFYDQFDNNFLTNNDCRLKCSGGYLGQ